MNYESLIDQVVCVSDLRPAESFLSPIIRYLSSDVNHTAIPKTRWNRRLHYEESVTSSRVIHFTQDSVYMKRECYRTLVLTQISWRTSDRESFEQSW